MKIFIISGKLNGMAKLSGKLQLVGSNFGEVQQIILFDGQKIKVIEKCDLERQSLEDKYVGIVLLGADKSVLGVGSTCGKIDVQNIMIQYNLLNVNAHNTAGRNSTFENQQKQTNFANNGAKIEVDLQKQEVETKDCSQNEQCKSSVKKDFDLADFVQFGLQNDDLLGAPDFSKYDLSEAQSAEKINCDLSENKEINTKKELDNFNCTQEQLEIVLSKNEDIEKGVDFVVEQLKCESPKKNYFAQIKADLNNFLRSYPKNEELESKVFGSKWVKITADYDYSVGVIFEDDKPSIIAYAEPYEDKSQVDASKLQLGEWLKIEEKSSKNRGYFVFYQNANTGEMILNTGY